jgi:hypothetical protein
MHRYPILLVSALALGCTADTTAPISAPFGVRLSIVGAANDQPNVVRYQTQFAAGIIDTKTDLLAFAGLPNNPKQALGCIGGTDASYGVLSVQDVGVMHDALREIAKADGVNLDVYRLSTFEGFCVSDPVAHGTGRVVYHDNDFYETGGGNNTFGWDMGGEVTLAGTNGATANLLAHNLWQLLPTGTFRRILRQVTLSGQ